MTESIFCLTFIMSMKVFLISFSSTDIAAKQDQHAAACDTSVPQLPQIASVNGNDKYLPM